MKHKSESNSSMQGLCMHSHCSSLAHFNIETPHSCAFAPTQGEASSCVATEGVEIIGVEPIGKVLFVAIQATRPYTTSIKNLI